jgi:hypothetical protein
MSDGGHLPDFLVIGAQKAGTTSVWHYLRAHPDVFMPELKEPYFFTLEGTWHRGLEWYTSLFAGSGRDQIAGEASPGYTMFPYFADSAGLIKATVPNVKLIYLIRDPIERMISSWVESRADGFEFEDLPSALRHNLFYVAASQYATQLKQYYRHFPPESLLIVRSEDLFTDPATAMSRICEFIGIDPAHLPESYERHNASDGRSVPKDRFVRLHRGLPRRLGDQLAIVEARRQPILTRRQIRRSDATIPDELRSRLTEYLELEMQELRRLVGPDLDLWGYA